MKKTFASLALVATALFGLSACSQTYTFEAVPEGVDDDDAETGLEGDPSRFECFTIEADSSGGDDDDQQLGTFCKTNANQDVDDDFDDQDDD